MNFLCIQPKAAVRVCIQFHMFLVPALCILYEVVLNLYSNYRINKTLRIWSCYEKSVRNVHQGVSLCCLSNLLWSGAKGDWDFWISDLVKSPMELIFNPCGEFR